MVVTALDEIAWLFNLRGSDIPFNPVFFSWALVTKTNGVTLYVYEPRQAGQGTFAIECEGEGISRLCVRPQDNQEAHAVGTVLQLGHRGCGGRGACQGVQHPASPIDTAKAVKNEVEVEGFRQCHIRDAAALCNFFGWLEDELAQQTKRQHHRVSSSRQTSCLSCRTKGFCGFEL